MTYSSWCFICQCFLFYVAFNIIIINSVSGDGSKEIAKEEINGTGKGEHHGNNTKGNEDKEKNKGEIQDNGQDSITNRVKASKKKINGTGIEEVDLKKNEENIVKIKVRVDDNEKDKVKDNKTNFAKESNKEINGTGIEEGDLKKNEENIEKIKVSIEDNEKDQVKDNKTNFAKESNKEINGTGIDEGNGSNTKESEENKEKIKGEIQDNDKDSKTTRVKKSQKEINVTGIVEGDDEGGNVRETALSKTTISPKALRTKNSTQEDDTISELDALEKKVLCKYQPNTNDCDNQGLKSGYFYDIKMQACRYADFGINCDNPNFYRTLRDCWISCRDVGQHSISNLKLKTKVNCNLQHDFGTCDGYFPRFYFHVGLRVCRGFSYSGCGGNGNSFETARECLRTCIPVTSDINTGKNTNNTNTSYF